MAGSSRDGWRDDIPRRRPRPSRRAFLRGSIGAAAAVGGGVLLSACGGGGNGAGGTTGRGAQQLQLASPEHPVTWPIAADNQPIQPGMEPERDTTLKLYNWADYINADTVKAFEKAYKKYNTKVQVSTFNTMEEALGKIRSGQTEFDVFFPTYDQLGKLVQSGLLRPIQHSYVDHIDQAWPVFKNPFYDQGWQYSVPYVVYTTGIAWRVDKVSEDIGGRPNPWDVFWDTRYKGRIGVLDDMREAMAIPLLRNKIYDLNTGDQAHLDVARNQLVELARTVNPVVNVKDYVDLPEGRTFVNHAWSGDMVNAQYYMPKGQSADVMRYWFPADSKGPVNNDLMVLMRGGKAPVLAHHFLNFMLDFDNAMENMSWNGYQPPQVKATPDLLVEQEYIPKELITAIVTEQHVASGLRELELSPEVEARWQDVWQEFKAGG
jgi:spermidine/putrescine transport system substrate-binding protein